MAESSLDRIPSRGWWVRAMMPYGSGIRLETGWPTSRIRPGSTGSMFAVDVLDLESMRLGKPRAVLSLRDRRISVGSQLERSYTVHPVTGELLVSRIVGRRQGPGLVFVDNWKALLAESGR